jgi:hypothetical protein
MIEFIILIGIAGLLGYGFGTYEHWRNKKNEIDS